MPTFSVEKTQNFESTAPKKGGAKPNAPSRREAPSASPKITPSFVLLFNAFRPPGRCEFSARFYAIDPAGQHQETGEFSTAFLGRIAPTPTPN
jgi:hypothetical protein